MKTPTRLAPLLVCLLVLALPAPAPADLDRPAGLEPAVEFWKRVYAEVDTHGGLIHDSEHLDVVYSVMRFPEGLSHRSREHQVEKEKRRLRGILLDLARGQRNGLSASEAEVLSRWPRDVSNETLREAAGRLRFQLGQADKFRAGLIRSGAWMDHIEHTLEHHGVPVELAALPHVESSFNPDAYSRVGAAGLWQFTRSTGRLFLRIDSVVDERLDPFVATDAAARLLKRNYELTEAWPLAITGYNHGAAGMVRASQQLGTKDMGVIARKYKGRTFGFASRNFYASFLAALEVSRDADRFFGPLVRQRPVDYTLISVPHFYRASTLSQALGVDVATLKRHNGGLRPAVWEGSKYIPRDYTLRVPRSELAERPSLLLAKIPQGERLAEQHRDRYYKVRRGDTLSRIASRHGVSMNELVALNHLRSRHSIRVGQVLVLPGGGEPAPSALAIASMEPPADGVYRVQRGDTLSIIAGHFGVSERALASENGLRNRHRIAVGQELRIPGARPTQIASAEPVPLRVTDAKPEPEPESEPTPQPERSERPATPARSASAKAPVLEPVTEPTPAAEPQPEPVAEPTPVAEPQPEPVAEPTPVAEPQPEPVVAALEPQEPEAVEPETEELVELELEAEAEATLEAESLPVEEGAPDDGEQTPPAKLAANEHPAHAPDPSDYSVHADGRITVQAEETIGHYADWLEVRASELRRRNGMRYGQSLVIGRQVRLDFRSVDAEEFERRRLEFHRTLQDEFFSAYEVTGTQTHVLRSGETLWYLAERKYQVPLWLLRQYNPDLDFSSLPAGTSMVVPLIEPRSDV